MRNTTNAQFEVYACKSIQAPIRYITNTNFKSLKDIPRNQIKKAWVCLIFKFESKRVEINVCLS